MIVTHNKKHGIDFYKVWFAERPYDKKGVIAYHQASFELKGSEVFDTLITDLKGSAEEIKGAFTKGCRYKVNRAEREGVSIRYLDDEAVTDEEIETFLSFFRSFWESKDTGLSDEDELRRDLKAYRDVNALSFAIATVNGQDAVYHTYLHDKDRVRLLHSASLYRLIGDEQSESRNVIGMANRYLHYMDMLHFKEAGITVYDWGGAGKGEDVINITEFKESFGGAPREDHDIEVATGFKAKLFKFIVSAMDDAILGMIRKRAD